jgi:hypothetical protein
LVPLDDPLIEIAESQSLAREPMAEITDNPKIAPCALAAMPLVQEPVCEQINMDT